MKAYYNENDRKKAAWLRQLIKEGLIAPGYVDERSIEEVEPNDLEGYEQCHFFAGIGIWSYALRLAGFPDNRRVWTGSCPCQPFSVAGEKRGTEDERHLWPDWFRLIAQCRPVVVFGEQVADGDGITWLDNVQSQMESIHYRVGACVLPASGFGAPHARHRTFFVADTSKTVGRGKDTERKQEERTVGSRGSPVGKLADTESTKRGTEHQINRESYRGNGHRRSESDIGVDNTKQEGLEGLTGNGVHVEEPGRERQGEVGPSSKASIPGPTNGFWSDAEWIPTRGKVQGTVDWRPIKPGTFPLVNGTAQRILRLRGYGDGIVAQVAAHFIKAYMTQ